MLIRKVFILKLTLPLSLAAWMLFGGALFWKGWTPALFWVSLAGTGIWALAALKLGCRPALIGPAVALALAAVLSMAGNPDLLTSGEGWVLVGLFGLAALVAGSELGEERLIHGLYWAGWIWLVAWPVPRIWGWVDNRNLLGVWPVVAILVILGRKKPWWLALPHIGVLLWLGSRGALLGLGVGLLAWYRPRLNLRQAALLAAAGLAFLWALAALRPEHALNRVAYWQQAGSALGDHGLWLGLGPGGIDARDVILEPGKPEGVEESYQPHAHNLVVQLLVELGLAGGLALVSAGLWVLAARIQGRWQIALLAALLTHSLVDLPLYFPGPLLAFMAVAGTVQGRDTAWVLQVLQRWLLRPFPPLRSSSQGRSLRRSPIGPESGVYWLKKIKPGPSQCATGIDVSAEATPGFRSMGRLKPRLRRRSTGLKASARIIPESHPIHNLVPRLRRRDIGELWVESPTLPSHLAADILANISPRLRFSHQWITLYIRSRYL